MQERRGREAEEQEQEVTNAAQRASLLYQIAVSVFRKKLCSEQCGMEKISTFSDGRIFQMPLGNYFL